MQEIIERLRAEGSALIDDTGSYEDLEAARVAVFGRKGSITLQLRGLEDVPAEQRPAAGAAREYRSARGSGSGTGARTATGLPFAGYA